MTEPEAFEQAVAWVKDEIWQSGTAEFNASYMAEGFVIGFMRGSSTTHIPQDRTAEMFWRENWRIGSRRYAK